MGLREEFESTCERNKYYRWYWELIERVIARPKSDGYVEKHHFVPKSFKPNKLVVCMTAREHFISHMLLVRFTTGTLQVKMIYALGQMMNYERYGRREVNSRLYDRARTEFANALSIRFRGIPKSPEHVDRVNRNPDKVRKTAEKHRGMKRSAESRERMSAAARGRVPWNRGMTGPTQGAGLQKKMVRCPWCGKTGGKPVMHRYHFDRCKNAG